jgi:8-oxo-dGTP pyrophosphatase MutT (NUDIX family)
MKHDVGVAVVLYDDHGHVLLEHRKKEFGHDLYTLVGGTLDEHDPIEGACREILEEVGIKLDKFKLVPVYIGHGVKPDGSRYLMLYYAAFVSRGAERNMEPDKCFELTWRPILEINSAKDMWLNDKLAAASADAILNLWERRVPL